MKLFCKALVRLLLASAILGLPRAALASPTDDSNLVPLSSILDGLSSEALENLAVVFSLGGCFGPG